MAMATSVMPGQCSLGSLCGHPDKTTTNQNRCMMCKRTLHLECAQLLDADSNYENQNDEDFSRPLLCCPAWRGCQAAAFAPTAAALTNAASSATKRKAAGDGRNTGTKTKTIGQKEFPVPLVPTSCFTGLNHWQGDENGQRYVDLPHPACEKPLIDPFNVAGTRKSSPFWILFSVLDKAKDEDVEHTAAQCCNLCGQFVKTSSDMSPTPLRRHIQRKHVEVYNICVEIFTAVDPSKPHGAASSKSKKAKKSKQASQTAAGKKVVRAQAKMIVSVDAPYDTVEDPHFRNMLHAVRAHGEDPYDLALTRDIIASEILDMSIQARKAIKKAMCGKVVHGTSDHWQSRDCRSFEGNCFQWIDETSFTVESVSCSMEEVIGSVNAEAVLTSYLGLCDNWDIKHCSAVDAIVQSAANTEKILMAVTTTDTAPVMNKFGLLLMKKTESDCIFCIDDLLQKTAGIAYSFPFQTDIQEEIQKALEGEDEKSGHNSTLRRCRKLVSLFDSSPKMVKLLKDSQRALSNYDGKEMLAVIQDALMTWLSTYVMLNRLLYLKPALDHMESQNLLRSPHDNANGPSRMLTEPEWEIVETVCYLLKPFKDADWLLDADNKVTSSLALLAVHGLDVELHNMSKAKKLLLHQSVTDCATKMSESLRGQFGDLTEPFQNDVVQGNCEAAVIHPHLIKASALDPRTKKLKQLAPENREAVWSAILKDMVSVRSKLAAKTTHREGNEPEQDTKPPPAPKRARAEASVFVKYDVDSSDDEEPNFELTDDEGDLTEECELELKRYQAAKGMKLCKDTDDSFECNDPLDWWKIQHAEFPTVWMLAKFYLGIPARSALSGRSFSTSRNLYTADRTGQITSSTASDHFLVRHCLKNESFI